MAFILADQRIIFFYCIQLSAVFYFWSFHSTNQQPIFIQLLHFGKWSHPREGKSFLEIGI